jgi:DNA polymerase I-like protein with 3'-5' exonuclease and polymerase domains
MMQWAPPQTYPDIPLNATIAYDTETKDTRLQERGPGWCFPSDDGGIVGFAIANAEDEWYFPLRHPGGNNMPCEEQGFNWLRHHAARPDITWLMFNAGYDIGWSARHGVKFAGKVQDASCMLALCDEYRFSYQLDMAGKDYLDARKDYSLMEQWAKENGIRTKKNIGAHIWRMPSAVVGPYAEQDGRLTYDLWHVLSEQANRDDLWRVYNLEMQLLPVLRAMRMRGVRVNLDKAARLQEDFKRQEDATAAELIHLAGKSVDVWDINAQILLLREEGVKEFPRTAKKQRDGLRKDFLATLAQHDNKAGKIAHLLLELRRFNKMRGTFCESLIFEHHENGRIHAEFHSMRGDDGGTLTGRLSSSNPNLQNLPSPERDEEMGKIIRGFFCPEEGEEWLSADWSSQEPRLAVHFAHAAKLPGAQEMVEAFIENPRLDLHQRVRDMIEDRAGVSIKRKGAKDINLGIMYGQGGGALSEKLGLPYSEKMWKGRLIKVAGPEGEAILAAHERIVPFIKELQRMAKDVAAQRGYIRTLYGRLGRFPLNDGERWYLHKALNKIIQGSAADMAKKAMIDCHDAGLNILAMVHDELCFSVPNRAVAVKAARIMRESTKLAVPVMCDYEMGRNWGELEKVELEMAI